MTEKMPVCIDGRLSAARETGVASYGHSVREALVAVGWHPEILMDGAGGRFGEASTRWASAWRAARAVLPVRVRLRRNAAPGLLYADDIYRLAHVRFQATGALLRLHADGAPGVMHWTYPIPAQIDGWANIYTVHDVIPLTAPHLSPIDPIGLRKRIATIARSADRIVTVSEWARQSILDALDIAPCRVTNCGSGVARMTPGTGALPSGLERNGYFLYCGLFETRKNIDRMIAGWLASGTTLPLVVTGPDKAEDHAVRAMILAQGATLLPYQSRPALIDLIQGARALVFPTLEEGFGLPIVEAMALGVPVITSDRAAMADTAGGAALLVDPESVASIATGFRRLQDDREHSQALSLAGIVRAEEFSPMAFGKRLTALYADLAGIRGMQAGVADFGST